MELYDGSLRQTSVCASSSSFALDLDSWQMLLKNSGFIFASSAFLIMTSLENSEAYGGDR